MKSDKRLLPLGKSGIWTLAKWGENDRGMYELITSILLQFNEPLRKEDIFAHILTTHPYIPISLFNLSINNRKFAQLKDKRIILAEWKYLHKRETAINKKGNSHILNEYNHTQIKEQILQLFTTNESDKLLLTNIVNVISQNHQFPKQLIYRRIRIDSDFITIKTEGQKGKQVILASHTNMN
jgi:hypothetical protein